ncbi:MAG TPA: hypothetical protein VG889_09665 [Rhizomicrobium sp.]|nr:hypothetical protein [Rhizomicrobium sp.]
MTGYLTPARLVLLPVGILSGLLLAEQVSFGGHAFGMAAVETFLGAMLRPIEVAFIRPLANWLLGDASVSRLYPHWRSIFILFWLFAGTAGLVGISARPRPPAHVGFVVVWGGLCALAAAALAGISPPSSPTIGRSMLAVLFIWSLPLLSLRPIKIWSRFSGTLAIGLAAWFGLFGGTRAEKWTSTGIPSPGLGLAVTIVLLLATISIAEGFRVAHRDRDRARTLLCQSVFRLGLDIYLVVGSVAAIAFL